MKPWLAESLSFPPWVPSNVGFDRSFLLSEPFSFPPNVSAVGDPLNASARMKTEILSKYHEHQDI